MTAVDTELLQQKTRLFLRMMAEQKLLHYAPYRWQQEFHDAGRDHPERMLMAANRVGKTMTAGAEVAMHLTGDYDGISRELRYPEKLNNGEAHPSAGELVWPNGWRGKRFPYPVTVWTGSPTTETSRDIVQKELLGGLGEDFGLGWVPKRLLVGQPSMRQAGVRNVVDTFRVRHVSGGVSACMLKSYDQGWQKWQGGAPQVVWLDEEPDDYMIYSEAQTRIISSGGIILVTFTPLLGQTDLVDHFMKGGKGIYIIGATWDQAPHLAKSERDRLTSSYRVTERDARTKGVPMLGEGAVFPISDDEIVCDPFKIPDHWARIRGCDFGIDHPAAGADCAWDRDQDVFYVVDVYRKANEQPVYHAAWFNRTNKWIPVAWPHDGMNRDKSGGGVRVAEAYRQHGVNMMAKSARYPKAPGEKAERAGAQPVEPIVSEMLERMMTGRFKVFRTCQLFFEEKRSYHRRDGRIVDRRDDVLKATAYALMMKRYAVAPSSLAQRVSTAPSQPIASARI